MWGTYQSVNQFKPEDQMLNIYAQFIKTDHLPIVSILKARPGEMQDQDIAATEDLPNCW